VRQHVIAAVPPGQAVACYVCLTADFYELIGKIVGIREWDRRKGAILPPHDGVNVMGLVLCQHTVMLQLHLPMDTLVFKGSNGSVVLRLPAHHIPSSAQLVLVMSPDLRLPSDRFIEFKEPPCVRHLDNHLQGKSKKGLPHTTIAHAHTRCPCTHSFVQLGGYDEASELAEHIGH
jgi:hypothetical protein